MRYSIISEDGTLIYDFICSLQKIVMAKIVTSLYMNQHTQQEIINLPRCCNSIYRDAFSEIEKNIVAKVSQLLLPDSIRQDLRCLASFVGEAIFRWIRYNDEHILSTEEYEYSAVDLIHNITWTTRGKIDYAQTAKNILAHSGAFLSDDHKYKLACNFCLEDEIALLCSKLVNQFYLSSMNIDKQPMVYFWTAHITGDRTPLNNPPYYNDNNRHRGNMSINEHIMQLLLRSSRARNDLPIKFMWNQLSNEEKNNNIALIFKNFYNLNPEFLISLLSNLDYGHQQNILQEWSETVLCAIIQDFWWWGNYFLPTALNVLDIMDPQSFWRVLHHINDKKRMSFQKEMHDHYKSLFKLLWQEGSMQLKEDTSRATLLILEMFIISELDWERDMDVIEVIFKDLSAQQKIEIAFRRNSIYKCACFIQDSKWNALDFFVKNTLSSEEHITRLKQRVIQKFGKVIVKSFLSHRKLYQMDCFMNWAFNSEEEIVIFRQSLNYTIPPLNE